MIQWIPLVLQLLPFVMRMMTLAEGVFIGPGRGAEKKEFVVEGAKDVINVVTAISGGGQKDTWERIGGPLNDIIDNLARIFFPPGKK